MVWENPAQSQVDAVARCFWYLAYLITGGEQKTRRSVFRQYPDANPATKCPARIASGAIIVEFTPQTDPDSSAPADRTPL